MAENTTSQNNNEQKEDFELLRKPFFVGKKLFETKLFFLLLNAALLLPFEVINRSVVGIVVFVISMGLAFIFMKKDEEAPACSFFPFLLLIDIICYLGAKYSVFYLSFCSTDYKSVLTFNTFSIIMYIFGILALWISLSQKKHTWLSGVFSWMIIATAIINAFGKIDLKALGFVNNANSQASGETILMVSVIIAFIWCALYYFSTLAYPKSRKTNIWVGIGIFAIAAIFLLFNHKGLIELSKNWQTVLFAITQNCFAWWRVIIYVVLLGGLTYFLLHFNNKFSADSYSAVAICVTIITARLLMTFYFNFCWLILPVFLFFVFKWIRKNNANGDKIDFTDLVVYSLATLLSIIFFYNGLWANVVFTLVFGYCIHSWIEKENAENINLLLLILVALYLEILAWIVKFRFHLSFIIVLTVFFLVTVIVMWIVNKKHHNFQAWSDEVEVGSAIMLIVSIIFSIAFILTLNFQYGVKINPTISTKDKVVTVEIEARGKENAVEKATYSWKNILGQKVVKDTAFNPENSKFEAKGEILTIECVDKNNVKVNKTIWFPHWLL